MPTAHLEFEVEGEVLDDYIVNDFKGLGKGTGVVDGDSSLAAWIDPLSRLPLQTTTTPCTHRHTHTKDSASTINKSSHHQLFVIKELLLHQTLLAIRISALPSH
jgi:hypothetical protein